jgi:hypothetical protein
VLVTADSSIFIEVFEGPASRVRYVPGTIKGAVMRTISVLSGLGLLCLGSAAQAASIITVVNKDTRIITTTSERGTATTEVTRHDNTITTRTTFEPRTYSPMGSSGGAYKPMGSGSGGYKPMGSGTYNPMGR